MNITKIFSANFLVSLILLGYPALLLTVQGGMSVMFILLVLVSFFVLSIRKESRPDWDKDAIAFALAMASPTVAIFASQAYHNAFAASDYDWAARFLFAIPIYLVLRQMNFKTLSIIQLGFPLGLLLGLALLLHKPFEWLLFHVDATGNEFLFHRYTTGQFFNLIHFADITLVIGFLSLASINFVKKDNFLLAGFKFSGFCAGLYMALQCNERTTWITAFALAIVWLMSFNQRKLLLKTIFLGVVVAFLVWASITYLEGVKARIESIQNELLEFYKGNRDTSVGIRFQLWLAAWHLFLENPVFGLGPNGFAHVMTNLAQSGVITSKAADLGRGEVHSEFLAKCVGLGIFGLFSILSVFLIPLAIFFRTARSNAHMHTVSFMGIGLIVAFFIFGLTVEIFNLKMTASFFSLTLAVLLAATTNKTDH